LEAIVKHSSLALACLLVGSPALALPETVKASTLHSALPEAWLACKVFGSKHKTTSDRFWTTCPIEQKLHMTPNTFNDEGVRGYFFIKDYLEGEGYMAPVHRLFKGHHILSTSEHEVNTLKNRELWTYEGIIGYVVKPDRIQEFRKKFGIEGSHTSTWYRFYNAPHDDHFFTTDAKEGDEAEAKYRFVREEPLGHMF
jgi:hypothetical protein